MLSLRSLARAAPRATCLATYSSKVAARPAFQTAFRSSLQTPRCFSTSFVRRDDAAQELAAKLSQEIDLESEENASPADSDSNLEVFKSQNPDWSIDDIAGEQDVLLTRKYEDETITVSFSIADFNTPMPEYESDEALLDEDDFEGQSGGGNTKGAINQGRTSGGNIKVASEDRVAPADREELRDEEDEYDGEDQPAFPASVNVLVQRPGKGALRINLITESGEFSVQSITHIPSSQTGSVAELLRDTNEARYAGPPFQQLDEELQSMIEQYLQVRGVNESLAHFIPEYIDVKEQKEYIGWLTRVKEFVD